MVGKTNRMGQTGTWQWSYGSYLLVQWELLLSLVQDIFFGGGTHNKYTAESLVDL